MTLDIALTVDAHWGTRSHYIAPVRRFVDGAPCYCLDLIKTDVQDRRRFGFYNRGWWRIEGDQDEAAQDDCLTLDAGWGVGNHWLAVVRQHIGLTLRPYLKLAICDADDPRRFGTYRGATWRIEGDA